MKSQKGKEKYIAFLRGINVGGHRKVPMAQLRKELEQLGFANVVTLLNSGNIIFEADTSNIKTLEKTISGHLEKVFSFPIPTIIRKSETIDELLTNDPFKAIPLTKDIRLYVSFLRSDVKPNIKLPWTSPDASFKILSAGHKTIISVLDLSVSITPKAMEALEKTFGSDITTRNWNTILRIEKKLGAKP